MDVTISDKPKRRGRPHAPVTSKGAMRRLREEAGLTQSELATITKISQNSISIAERTGRGLTEDNWQSVAKALNSSVFILRGWKKIFAE